jgi:hypothetical protein
MERRRFIRDSALAASAFAIIPSIKLKSNADKK